MLKISPFQLARNISRSRINFYCTVKPLEQLASETSSNVTKTSVLQKWISYWKTLLNDYKDVLIDAGKHAKDHPVRSITWLTIFTGAYTCGVMNPDEHNFRTQIINRSNELIFVGNSIRNPAAVNHLKTIEDYYNSDQIRRISFGIFSVILHDYKTKTSGRYQDNCSYTQPTYLEIIQNHVIDIGFWNKWWILERKWLDYDVNDAEWQ